VKTPASTEEALPPCCAEGLRPSGQADKAFVFNFDPPRRWTERQKPPHSGAAKPRLSRVFAHAVKKVVQTKLEYFVGSTNDLRFEA
jgi:hypothetical protein